MDILDFMSRIVFSVGDQPVTIGQLILAPTLAVIAYFLTKWISRQLGNQLARKNANPDAVHLIRRVLYVLAIAITIITILDVLGIPLTAFAFISGAIAIGIGFGAQNIINNFISGWILMWERPIKIGDFLEIGDTKGTVEAINTRSTRIRRVDGVHLLIPNSYLLENTVVNWTLVDRLTRGVVRVGVAYGSPVQEVRDVLNRVMRAESDILDEPSPCVIFEDFGDNALIFDAYFWINALAEKGIRDIKSDLRYAIEAEFNASGIVIAFPQRDIHIDGSLQLHNASQLDR